MEHLLVPSLDFKEQNQRLQMDAKHILSTPCFPKS